MTTQEKLERHRIEEGVDTYVFTLAELTALIDSAKREGAIEELESFVKAWFGDVDAFDYRGELINRIKALKEEL